MRARPILSNKTWPINNYRCLSKTDVSESSSDIPQNMSFEEAAVVRERDSGITTAARRPLAASIERKALGPPISSRHGTRGTTRSMLRSRSALENRRASTEFDGVSVMRMHLKTGWLLFAATLRTGIRTLVSG
jgi:hypothetical protein